MADKTSKIVIPPAAGAILYKAYRNGTFGKIKKNVTEMLGGDDSNTPEPQDAGYIDPEQTIEICEADTIHGLPRADIVFDPEVFQFYPDTCAIQSQHLVLQQFGIEVSQEELIRIAKENGWYAEGYGTPPEMVGKLLEYFGVEVQGSIHNNIFNLASELAQGHQIIVGVDAFELIDPIGSIGVDQMMGEHANHALVVVGIDTTDPANVQVIVTDPGTGNRQYAYPADQFVDAWKDSDCFMVTTENAPAQPGGAPFMPIEHFGSLATADIDRLADASIDLSDTTAWHDFYNSFVLNHSDLDELINSHSDLFDFGSTDGCADLPDDSVATLDL